MPSKPNSVNISNRILRNFFNFHMPLDQGVNGIWKLNPKYSVGETSDNKNNIYTLWRFPINEELAAISKNISFYYSFSIQCGTTDEIEELGIKIFKEDISIPRDSTLIPTELLLRVDWSNIKNNGQIANHAQPHWHVHPYRYDSELEKASPQCRDFIIEALKEEQGNKFGAILSDNEEEQENITAEIKLPPYKFHLAMIADWDTTKDSPNDKDLTDDILNIWLPNCINYIKNQIEYILSRT